MLQRAIALQKFLIIIYIACSLHAFTNDNVSTLKNYIASEYKRLYPELTIESISLITRNTLDLYTITIISKQINTIKSANGYLTLQYKHNDRVLQDSIRYTINGHMQVYVATENIKAGSNINTNSFIGKTQDFSSLALIPASKHEILQSSAKVYIPMNAVIYRNKLAKRMLVVKDSNVKILFREYGIEASASGRALENGVQGDIIKVENLESKRIVNAKVIAENIVQIY
ncbi:flagellar basal body P-ring formation chaperone FlgA [Helicobacter trogontum]|uniref:Flagella basal body P-ring formation protein FlgA n=1 Tax=Helicobacter trogontum TaxID=50960 RepID=A0A4U8TH31_9HELI|nr:flagellar basal body P-ring formation chaperone FlgA [Helicobacter trogontum]MDY5185662.1 flagellar basal body P-ring formation chaperone FlgA [Helicobacter trogontum]TLD99486.1 flagellar basal body P-ring formation protein FlgA [Helicobacter trogontum]